MSRIWTYFSNSTVHGFNYIADKRRHWSERLFWIATCFVSGLATWQYLQATWYAYNNNAVSFVADTTYLDWNTSFLSLSVCEQESPDKLFDSAARELCLVIKSKGNKAMENHQLIFLERKMYNKDMKLTKFYQKWTWCPLPPRVYGVNRDSNIDFYLRDIAFYDGTCYSCVTHCQKDKINCTTDFDTIIREIRAKCHDIIGNCYWNDEPFECCDQFLPIMTENGVCFSINNLHTVEKNGEKLKMISNRKLGPGSLSFLSYESIKLYIHSPEDLPYVNHPQEEKFLLSWGVSLLMKYQIKEIENDPLLKQVSIKQRNCRFPDENNLRVYNVYSNSACIVNCRAEAQLKQCNCTPHYLRIPGTPMCGIEGLGCITEHSEVFRALKTYDFNKLGLVCDCVSSCTEPEYNVLTAEIGSITTEEQTNDNESKYGSKIVVSLDRLPNERLKRNVVRSRMDLIVSIGGTLSLFLGVSVLSIVEIIYYFIVWTRWRPMRAVMNNAQQSAVKIKKRQVKNVNRLPFLH